MSPEDSTELDILAEVTLANPSVRHMPVTISQDLIRASILGAHEFGLKIAEEIGDEAYRRLHS